MQTLPSPHDWPVGTIMPWSGAIVDIPSGWFLCDGNNGTPDLRNRFLVGAGGTYAPGATGGSAGHNHDLTTDGHVHTIPGGLDINFAGGRGTTSLPQTDTATTNPTDSRPSYYALALVMWAG